MKYSDIYRLYSTSQPKDAIHQALREVPVDDSDEQYEDRSPLHLACQYGDTEGVKILLERDAEPNTKDANGSTPIHILGRTSAGCADEDKLDNSTGSLSFRYKSRYTSHPRTVTNSHHPCPCWTVHAVQSLAEDT